MGRNTEVQGADARNPDSWRACGQSQMVLDCGATRSRIGLSSVRKESYLGPEQPLSSQQIVPESRQAHLARPVHHRTLPTMRQSEPAVTGTASYSRRSETRASICSNRIKRETSNPFSLCVATTIWPTRLLFSVSAV